MPAESLLGGEDSAYSPNQMDNWSGSICHKVNFRGIFMVKANQLPRCVKGNLRNTKNVVGNFVTCTGGRYGGLF